VPRYFRAVVSPQPLSSSPLNSSCSRLVAGAIAAGAAALLALSPVSAATALSAAGSASTDATVAAPVTVAVSTSAELQSALDAATPGQVIELADGTYAGAFRSSRSGTRESPVTLRGSREAVLTVGSLTGTTAALTLSGKAWNLVGFSVSESPTGVILSDSDNSVIDDVAVTTMGSRGIQLRRSSAYVTVRNAMVSDTGIVSPGAGEGIYVGSAQADWAVVMGSAGKPDRTDHVRIEHSQLVNTAAEGVDIREGTTGGRVAWNVFDNAGHSRVDSGDSWVDVRGNTTSVWANAGFTSPTDAFQVHTDVAGWGLGNRFRDNVVMDAVPGYEVNAGDAGRSTVVYCTYSNAGRGLSNVPCTAY